jgi:hypothetical protein
MSRRSPSGPQAQLAALRERLREAELLLPAMRAELDLLRKDGANVDAFVPELEALRESILEMKARYRTLRGRRRSAR